MPLQCLSILVLNSPYNRLKTGLLSKVVRQLRPLLAIKGKLRLQKSPGGGGYSPKFYTGGSAPRFDHLP